ncbi:MAG TPA: phosphohistidine phosphatase SixA [Bacteroidota bacterium]|nr:phosphohistidine phosphatase SixA [Bacteroidota bacterium]
MNLFILRHAIAMERGVEFQGADADRPLSPKGRKKMVKIARAMKALELSFDLILSSPFTRARETAELAARELSLESVLEYSSHLESGGDPAKLVADLSARVPAPENILLVGHEPQLSHLISVLLSGEGSMEIAFKKGGLCKLEVATLRFARCAALHWLLTPNQLASLAD